MNLQLLIERLKQYPIAVIFGLLAIALGAAAGIRWTILSSQNERYEVLLGEADLHSDNRVNATGLERSVVELEGALARIETGLFDRRNVALNQNFFYGLENKLEIQMIQVVQRENSAAREKAPDQLKHFDPIDFSLEVGGSYAEILKLLHYLRTHPRRVIGIIDVEIGPDTGAMAADTLRATVLVRTFGKAQESGDDEEEDAS